MGLDQLPVTILSGGLGAGKTTLVNHLLTEGGKRHDIAVLVNDVGEINVDADLIETGSELSMDDGITELSNGCICCGLQSELDRELVRLATEASVDYLVIEASGISDPVPIAGRFVSPARASALYDLDTTVTVVDAAQFHRAFVAGEPLTPTTDEGRPLSELLVEQVEFCDLVVLNKCDLVSDAEWEAVEEVLDRLHPGVDIVRATESAIDPELVLGTGRFDPDEANTAARWKQILSDRREDAESEAPVDGADGKPDSHEHDDTLDEDHDHADDEGHTHDEDHTHDDHNHDHTHDDHDHLHPPEEFGVDSFVYESNRPFHPERLLEWLGLFPDSVVRAKGHLWVAGRERYALDLSQAGTQIHVGVNGRWVASLPEAQQASYRESRPELNWDDQWGDRETQLVFIGAGMDEEALTATLDDCLVDNAELAADWTGFENPFPGRDDDSRPPTDQRLVIDSRGSLVSSDG